MIKITDNKIAVFSDSHWGKNRDNVQKIYNAEKFIDFFIRKISSENINTVFFLGDYFDNRNSINVNTGNVAYRSLKKLCNKFTVYMLVGNHDLYFKNSSVEVNSLKQFEDIDNLHIIETTTEVTINGKNILLCPWHFKIQDYQNKQYDYMFGHFEMDGAALCGTVSTGNPYNMKQLTEISPIVFSGHFHIRKQYDFENGIVITVGSPYQLDWGDVNNQRGFYIIDIQSNQHKFIENTISPIHYQIYWSRLKDKSQKILKKYIENNYIKLIIDSEYDYQDILKTVDKINKHNPISCTIDYVFSVNRGLLGELKLNKTGFKMTKLQYILKYIEKMDIQSDIDKDILSQKARQYYQSCIYE